MAKIRKRYNQVPHLTQDTTWESNKNTINITNKSQEFRPFAGGEPIVIKAEQWNTTRPLDKSVYRKTFFLSSKTYVVDTQKNPLNEIISSSFGTQTYV